MKQPTSDLETQHLRVLIANERTDRLALVAPIVVPACRSPGRTG